MNVLASMNIMESDYTALPYNHKMLFLRVTLKFTGKTAIAKRFASPAHEVREGARPC